MKINKTFRQTKVVSLCIRIRAILENKQQQRHHHIMCRYITCNSSPYYTPTFRRPSLFPTFSRHSKEMFFVSRVSVLDPSETYLRARLALVLTTVPFTPSITPPVSVTTTTLLRCSRTEYFLKTRSVARRYVQLGSSGTGRHKTRFKTQQISHSI